MNPKENSGIKFFFKIYIKVNLLKLYIMKITASRLSDGNKIFPAEIHVESTGITIKIPGLFSGESKYFDFQNIASVDVNTPMMGFSTITIYAGGTKMTAHGFSKSDVKQVKEAIESGKLNVSSSTNYASSTAAATENPTPKKSVDGIFARKLGLDDASMEHKRQNAAADKEKRNEELKNAAASAGKFIGGVFNSGDRKKAQALHQELVAITDDIDIAIAMNKKEEALELIKKLQHTSPHKVVDTEIGYNDYWSAKRKEYISKLTT